MPSNKITNKKIILGWLKKGDDDLNFAKSAFEETEFYDHVCFLSQQAVEKYLKAIVIINRGELRKQDKTHNLIYLANLCKKEVDLSDFEEELRKLSDVWIALMK